MAGSSTDCRTWRTWLMHSGGIINFGKVCGERISHDLRRGNTEGSTSSVDKTMKYEVNVCITTTEIITKKCWIYGEPSSCM